MSKFRDSEKSQERTARVPFSGPRLKLQLSAADEKGFKDRGMVARWFNDESGRIGQALGGGYNYVAPENAGSLGQGAIHRGSTDPSKARVSVVVSRGDPIIRAYLMEIKKEYWEQDQASKEGVNQKVDEALAAGGAGGASIENQYGKGVTYSH